MKEQSKKEKIKILITGIFCLILMFSILGYTYSYMFVSDKDNTVVKGETECYTVNYTKGQDISGSLTPGTDYTSGKNTDIIMYSEPGCGIMYGTLYITTNQDSTMDFSDNALRYTVVKNNSIVSQGVVNGTENQIIYNNFVLNDEKTTYQVYIWLDEDLESATLIDETFSGFIHAEAITASNVTSYVLEGSSTVSENTAKFLSTSIPRNEIQSITFIDTDNINEFIETNNNIERLNGVDPESENGIPWFDVSLVKDDSVKLYYTDKDNNNLYEVLIGTETGTTIASSGYYLFSYLTNMESINLTNEDNTITLDTSRVTTMEEMFRGCILLTELDLSGFDTSNVTSMKTMFASKISIGIMALTEIKGLENFDTSNVTNMLGMFQYCSNLTSLNVSNFDTEKVTDTRNMFAYCSKLTSLDVSNFDTSNVTTMQGMFSGSDDYPMYLTEIKGIEDFDTKNVSNMRMMFSHCRNLSELKLNRWKTSNVTDMYGMFGHSYTLEVLDLSGWDTGNVTDMGYMFGSDQKATSLMSLTSIIGIEDFDTTNVINMRAMFYKCEKLTSLDLSEWDTGNVTDMASMFYQCKKLTSLDISNFNTSKVSNMSQMFGYCRSLTSLNLSSFKTSKVSNMSYMFVYCDSLTTLDLSNFITTGVTNMAHMFWCCTRLTNLNVTSFNTEKVTNMQAMFGYCSSLTSLDISNFNTSRVTSMSSMFFENKRLVTIYSSNNFITTSVTSSTDMFTNCNSLVGENGTAFIDVQVKDHSYAKIDGGTSSPGYFTIKSA